VSSLEKIIKVKQEECQRITEEIEKFDAKRANEYKEQKSAQRAISPKLVKRVYKFLKNKSDPILVTLVETYVAFLIKKPYAGPRDVELYFQKHRGLQVAMDKVDTSAISGTLVQTYLRNINNIRNQFKQGSKYVKYIPILAWINATCHLVKWSIEEKTLLGEREQVQEDIELYQQSIEHVDGLKAEGIALDQNDFHNDFKKISNVHTQMTNSLKMINARIEVLSTRFSGFTHKFLREAHNPGELLDLYH
jgi:hypothetical protein